MQNCCSHCSIVKMLESVCLAHLGPEREGAALLGFCIVQGLSDTTELLSCDSKGFLWCKNIGKGCYLEHCRGCILVLHGRETSFKKRELTDWWDSRKYRNVGLTHDDT